MHYGSRTTFLVLVSLRKAKFSSEIKIITATLSTLSNVSSFINSIANRHILQKIFTQGVMRSCRSLKTTRTTIILQLMSGATIDKSALTSSFIAKLV